MSFSTPFAADCDEREYKRGFNSTGFADYVVDYLFLRPVYILMSESSQQQRWQDLSYLARYRTRAG